MSDNLDVDDLAPGSDQVLRDVDLELLRDMIRDEVAAQLEQFKNDGSSAQDSKHGSVKRPSGHTGSRQKMVSDGIVYKSAIRIPGMNNGTHQQPVQNPNKEPAEEAPDINKRKLAEIFSKAIKPKPSTPKLVEKAISENGAFEFTGKNTPNVPVGSAVNATPEITTICTRRSKETASLTHNDGPEHNNGPENDDEPESGDELESDDELEYGDELESGDDKVKSDNETKSPRSKKRRGTVKEPRKPGRIYRRYNTNFYVQFDPQKQNVGTPVTAPFKSFSHYDNYTLFVSPLLRRQDFKKMVPTSGVRLDDRTMALALMLLPRKELHAGWPADFDKAGMPRATRVPLGHAFKEYKKVGDVDIDGVAVTKAGWYYMWWRGLHCLMGKEGLDADLYQVRPSFERFKCKDFGFKIDYMAVVQLPAGSTRDYTFS